MKPRVTHLAAELEAIFTIGPGAAGLFPFTRLPSLGNAHSQVGMANGEIACLAAGN
jgi:hypothetical protein